MFSLHRGAKQLNSPLDSPLISPSFSSGKRNRAYWASHPQKSVTLQPQPGGEFRYVYKIVKLNGVLSSAGIVVTRLGAVGFWVLIPVAALIDYHLGSSPYRPDAPRP